MSRRTTRAVRSTDARLEALGADGRKVLVHATAAGDVVLDAVLASGVAPDRWRSALGRLPPRAQPAPVLVEVDGRPVLARPWAWIEIIAAVPEGVVPLEVVPLWLRARARGGSHG